MQWVLGALLIAAPCLAIATNEPLTPTSGVPSIPDAGNLWPWLALGAIALLLGVIALAARRRLPFGRR